jgi:peptidoglycan/xylan/chitin deacetylase (PgdA/CDA1 family)
MLFQGVAPAVSANTSANGVISATSGINIRACPTLECQIIGSASLGEPIEITGDVVDGFYPVLWYGREGYAYALYVSRGGQAPWFVEGDDSCERVALVFNIGIGEEPSQAIVDTLVETGTAASMFPMGWWAEAYPDFLLQLDEAGFVIGTHGDEQVFLTSLDDEAVSADVTNSVDAIEAVIGRDIDQFFTPYAADSDERVRAIVSAEGLLPVGWNVAANDYGSDATEEGVYTRVMTDIYPGAVIEMHLDGPATDQSTARALPRLIADLQSAGYEFVTVPELTLPCAG